MVTSRVWRAHRQAVASTVLGLLLVGTAASPAVADSVRDKQWHLDAMRAEQMWRTSTGKGVTVAVIDSGVDWTNGDLKGQVLSGKNYDPMEPGDEHTDPSGHGTGMAGLIAGTGKSGGDGAFGLAPEAKILPLRVAPDDEVIAEAIRYAADSRAKVINISMGGGSGGQALTAAVAYALRKGSLIFASVGNSGDKRNQVEYPGATPGVVGVGAVGKDLHRAAWSQHGPQVDMAAPGDEMVHACGGKTGLCMTNGTSDATALASASAALIWSAHPDWTNNQILRVMLNTIGGPTDGAERNDSIGYGIVRPRIALTDPGDPGPADEYPLPDLAAAASASPTPPPSTGANPPETPGSRPQGDEPGAAASSAGGDGGMSVLWYTIAAVVVVGAVTALTAAVRRRGPA
jgi:type VII secretion-associated serine protease mycosin